VLTNHGLTWRLSDRIHAGKLPIDYVEVGPADTLTADLHDHVARTRSRYGSFERGELAARHDRAAQPRAANQPLAPDRVERLHNIGAARRPQRLLDRLAGGLP
jgi:hypothetical protein